MLRDKRWEEVRGALMSAFCPEKLNEVRDRKHTFFLLWNRLRSKGKQRARPGARLAQVVHQRASHTRALSLSITQKAKRLPFPWCPTCSGTINQLFILHAWLCPGTLLEALGGAQEKCRTVFLILSYIIDWGACSNANSHPEVLVMSKM